MLSSIRVSESEVMQHPHPAGSGRVRDNGLETRTSERFAEETVHVAARPEDGPRAGCVAS